MIAEISAVVGILKALNEGISTVKESGSHLTGLTGVFDSLTKSKAAVEQIESEVNEGNHLITQEEALQLAWAKNDIREKEKELKKITPRLVWRDMLAIQHKSLMDDKQRREKARLAKNRAITKRDAMLKNVFGVAFLSLLGGAVWYAVEVMGVLK
jgi:hypothetical protein|tara:strand:- start:347 stop:811 length:465 start_codon:yes stop_codon:yes gene_type:complete